MKQDQIQVGHYYLCKISGNVVPVKVDSEDLRDVYRKRKFATTGLWGSKKIWRCTSQTTGRKITVNSASRFRAECDQDGKVAADRPGYGRQSNLSPEDASRAERCIPYDGEPTEPTTSHTGGPDDMGVRKAANSLAMDRAVHGY